LKFLGINGAAKAGDDFIVLDTEKEAKELSKTRLEEHKNRKGSYCNSNTRICI
jgi:Translation initiation factor 2 (IF-2; GTPase)